jgi:tripartite-type tricarboxylate transporter receptor subunit TctC
MQGAIMVRSRALCIASFVAAVAAFALPAVAEPAADFYKGKTLNLIIGFPPGAGYDAYGRLLARHLGGHLPGNPNVVPQNMPGAGAMKATNYLYSVAAKDGTVIGHVPSSVIMEQLFGNPAVQFDAAKFTWIGNMDQTIGTCAVWHTSGIERFEDLMTKPTVFGGSGPSGVNSQHAAALKNLLGAKIKLIQGYPGSNQIKLAMEKGELQGACGMALSSLKSQHANEYRSGELKPIVQLAPEKNPELPRVAHIYDYAKDEEMRQIFDLVFGPHIIGRPVVAPPGIAADRKAALRAAFMATMNDPAFRADAKKMKLDITPSDGAWVERLFAKFFSYPKPVVTKAIAAMRD